jgi:hypothetical protein
MTNPSGVVDAGASDPLHDALFGANDAEQLVGNILANAEPDDAGPGDTPAPAVDAPADPPTVPAAEPADAEPGDTPDADAAEPADSPTTPDDPFAVLMKDAKPLTYKQDGAERTFDAILSVGDGKPALIPPERVAEVRDMVARYEHNRAANNELYQTVQKFEQQFGGYKGITEKLEVAAQTNAAAMHILDAVMKDPLAFVARDEAGNIVRNDYALNLLRKEATLAAREAQWQARTEWQQAEHTFAASTSEAQTRAVAIPNAIDTHFAHVPVEDRTQAKAFFTAMGDALMFKATPEQALQFGVAPGTLMVDLPKMAPYFAQLAAAREASSKAATAQAQAAKFNAAQEKPTTGTPAKPLPPRKPTGQFRSPTRS